MAAIVPYVCDEARAQPERGLCRGAARRNAEEPEARASGADMPARCYARLRRFTLDLPIFTGHKLRRENTSTGNAPRCRETYPEEMGARGVFYCFSSSKNCSGSGPYTQRRSGQRKRPPMNVPTLNSLLSLVRSVRYPSFSITTS